LPCSPSQWLANRSSRRERKVVRLRAVGAWA